MSLPPAKRSPQTAVFVGLARECQQYLGRALANVEKMASCYDAATFVFIVGTGEDATAEILSAWLAAGRTGQLVEFGKAEARFEKRTMRLAYARNVGLRLAEGLAPEADHLVMTDLDDVLSGEIDVAAFDEARLWLGSAADIAAVCANAYPRYYDIWALRHRTWCPSDCWQDIWNRPSDRSFAAAKFGLVHARQLELAQQQPPIPVDAAFGGLAVYKHGWIRGCRYIGVAADGREVAEHVPFNEAIRRRGGRVFIYPRLQVRAPAEHLFAWHQWRLRDLPAVACHSVLAAWRRRALSRSLSVGA